jgi:hypothetical protein
MLDRRRGLGRVAAISGGRARVVQHGPPMSRLSYALWLGLVVLGCGGISQAPTSTSSAHAEPRALYGYVVQPADTDPVSITRAPRSYYRGAFAHYLDGQWYYPTATGWVVFVEVPAELARVEDSIGTEQPPLELPGPRGPTVERPPAASGAFSFPPPRLR